MHTSSTPEGGLHRLPSREISPVAVWEHIFGDSEGDSVEWMSIFVGERPPGKEGKINKQKYRVYFTEYFRWADQKHEAADYARKMSEKGYNTYFCAHLLVEPRREKENAAPVQAVYAEGDEAKVPDGVPRPTCTIETSPGRYQYFWKLKRKVAPKEAEALNRRLTKAIGADSSGWDLTQLMRVPGTKNHDYTPKYGEPPIVRVKEIW